MKLAKKARIRAKQIRAGKRKFEKMTDEQMEVVFGKVFRQVKKFWAKRGFHFNTNTL